MQARQWQPMYVSGQWKCTWRAGNPHRMPRAGAMLRVELSAASPAIRLLATPPASAFCHSPLSVALRPPRARLARAPAPTAPPPAPCLPRRQRAATRVLRSTALGVAAQRWDMAAGLAAQCAHKIDKMLTAAANCRLPNNPRPSVPTPVLHRPFTGRQWKAPRLAAVGEQPRGVGLGPGGWGGRCRYATGGVCCSTPAQ